MHCLILQVSRMWVIWQKAAPWGLESEPITPPKKNFFVDIYAGKWVYACTLDLLPDHPSGPLIQTDQKRGEICVRRVLSRQVQEKRRGGGGITVIDLVKGGEGDLPNVEVHLRIKDMRGFSVFFTDDFCIPSTFFCSHNCDANKCNYESAWSVLGILGGFFQRPGETPVSPRFCRQNISFGNVTFSKVPFWEERRSNIQGQR